MTIIQSIAALLQMIAVLTATRSSSTASDMGYNQPKEPAAVANLRKQN